jgi:hypothetical protein
LKDSTIHILTFSDGNSLSCALWDVSDNLVPFVLVPIFLVILAPSIGPSSEVFLEQKTIDFGETQNQIVDNEIIELLQKGTISECKHEDNDLFISEASVISFILFDRSFGNRYSSIGQLAEHSGWNFLLT